jgi:hypothetical protein
LNKTIHDVTLFHTVKETFQLCRHKIGIGNLLTSKPLRLYWIVFI